MLEKHGAMYNTRNSKKVREVFFPPCEDSNLNSIYGKWDGGKILLPEGMSGEELLKICKQTEAERLECIKRGAELE